MESSGFYINEAPTVNIITPQEDEGIEDHNRWYTVSASISDPDNDSLDVNLMIYDESMVPMYATPKIMTFNSSSDLYEFTLDLESYYAGTYTFNVSAFDGQETVIGSVKAYIDETHYAILNIIHLENIEFLSTGNYFEFEISSNYSATYGVWINGVEFDVGSYSYGTYVRIISLDYYSDKLGDYSVRIEATDSKGHNAETTASFSVYSESSTVVDITHLNNYEFKSEGNYILFNISSKYPDQYTFSIDDVEIDSGVYTDGQEFNYSIDGYLVGTHHVSILDDFALVFADASGQDVKEILDGLELSKSIDYNCKKFRIKFKTNINHTFEIISKQKDEIFNTIIPNCPEDKICIVLENKLEEFDQRITENVKIKEINLSSVGLKVFEKLPYNIKIALERAERYFRIFRLYNEESYGPSVLELAKSLEILLKILINEFISSKDVINCLNIISGDSRIQKELPIVPMIKNGVKSYTIGSFLYIIQETWSYPEECNIKQELINFLKKNLPVDLSNIIKLREITNYRNDYAHIAGEIITLEQYFNFRSLIFQIINLLRVDLSDIKINSVLTSKVEMTKVA